MYQFYEKIELLTYNTYSRNKGQGLRHNDAKKNRPNLNN